MERALRRAPVVSNRSVRRGESTAARACANARSRSSASGSKARRETEDRGFAGAQHRQLQPNEMTKLIRKVISKAEERRLALKIEVTGHRAKINRRQRPAA
jgi:hypothetical protein